MRRWLIVLCLLALPAQAHPPGNDSWDERAIMPGMVWGSRIAIEDRACCDAAFRPSNDPHEAALMAAEPGRARREDRRLELSLIGRRTLTITDCDDERTCNNAEWRRHRWVGWWPMPGIRYYVVDVQPYEGQMGFLVRESDGLVVRLGATPSLSPDGRHAIAWHSFVIDGGPSMELIDLDPREPAVRSIYPTKCPGHDEEVYPGPRLEWHSAVGVTFPEATLLARDAPKFTLVLHDVTEQPLRWECRF